MRNSSGLLLLLPPGTAAAEQGTIIRNSKLFEKPSISATLLEQFELCRDQSPVRDCFAEAKKQLLSPYLSE